MNKELPPACSNAFFLFFSGGDSNLMKGERPEALYSITMYRRYCYNFRVAIENSKLSGGRAVMVTYPFLI